ncbi:MAG TPA: thermonuclease family protein [Thermoanaerobaculaceae bacterium]|nr:thermonuclease family protein [Thermoanaerobaculaceae bacterium]HPS76864.1 thermonuclease family protein [Thermoanaerobaculaceae bacterium]
MRASIGRASCMVAACVVTLLVAGGAAGAERFSGRVVSVRDGDTIEILRAGRAVRVRLWGVDCPELAQGFGQRAKQRTAELVFGRNVQVSVVDHDRYGRLVARVEVEGRDLGEELIGGGMAWWYRYHAPRQRSYEQAERTARAARRGLWSDGTPIEPWKYRQHHPR